MKKVMFKMLVWVTAAFILDRKV